MLLRTLWLFWTKRFLKPAKFSDKTVTSMRVLPVDLDILMHVNNGVYFSYMDFGRWNMIFRNGVMDISNKMGWYSVVAGETIKFRRSLKLWNKFTIETQLKGHDEKYFYIQQRFLCKSELMATGMVKVRFLKRKGGTVATEEVLAQFHDTLNNEATELGQEWFGLENKYLT